MILSSGPDPWTWLLWSHLSPDATTILLSSPTGSSDLAFLSSCVAGPQHSLSTSKAFALDAIGDTLPQRKRESSLAQPNGTNTCPEPLHMWDLPLVNVPLAWLQNRSLASFLSSLQNLAQGLASIRRRKEWMVCRCKGTLVDGVNNWHGICWVPCDPCKCLQHINKSGEYLCFTDVLFFLPELFSLLGTWFLILTICC